MNEKEQTIRKLKELGKSNLEIAQIFGDAKLLKILNKKDLENQNG